jgi:Dyp-type peroxidase family
MTVQLDLRDIQGLFARGYRQHPYARFTVFTLDGPPAGRALLQWLLPRITAAAPFSGEVALQVAFTASGLRQLGLPDHVMTGFSAEFRQGMINSNRSRFLGDTASSDPRGWAWGGPAGPAADAVVMLYATGPDLLERWQAELRQQLGRHGASGVTELPAQKLGDTEPFGFHDGISQPIIAGLPRATRATRPMAAGEFVLGYPNGRGQLTSRPLVPASEDPMRLLLPDPAGSGAADFGRDGTYLVFRQLEQDVDGFWRFVDQAAGGAGGPADPAERAAFAAKMVGRWPSGAPLVKAPDQDAVALADDNDFAYRDDPRGLACPIGAHIRRANPRDSLGSDPADSLRTSDRHRLLRRARSYDLGRDGGTGLYFICLAGDLGRQFEFVQHTWLNDATFNGLYDDTDPLTGNRDPAGATFTVPARPVRRRYRGLPQFVRTRGGAYFFLPGISAVRYLAQLDT